MVRTIEVKLHGTRPIYTVWRMAFFGIAFFAEQLFIPELVLTFKLEGHDVVKRQILAGTTLLTDFLGSKEICLMPFVAVTEAKYYVEVLVEQHLAPLMPQPPSNFGTKSLFSMTSHTILLVSF